MNFMYIIIGWVLLYSIFLIGDGRKPTIDDCMVYVSMLCLQLGLMITG